MTAAKCFAEAAASYDHNAQLQRWAGDLLLARAKPFGSWLDVGCGTGYVSARLPTDHAIGVDLAMPMLRQQSSALLLQGDMHQLPLADTVVGGVAANLSLQWSDDMATALQQALRVCKPSGQLLFTVPAVDTFPELRGLVGGGQLACNRFVEAKRLQQLTEAAGWRQVRLQPYQTVLYFNDAKALLKHFKLTGAQYSQRAQGLKGRRWWHSINRHLEQFRQPEGIPLTWRIYLVEAER